MTDRYPDTIHIPAAMAAKIDEPIDPALISRRPGGGNTTQSYLKGDIIADQLNSVFGPLGWSKQSRIHTVDDWDEDKNVTRSNAPATISMHMVQVISDVTLTIKKVTADGTDTVFVEQGIGYGEIEAGKSRKEAFGMAVKGASTDGLKRCASLLGKAFGMMMSSSGKQDDIDYAHNNKPNDIRNARNMRGNPAGGSQGGGREDGRGNGRADARDEGRGAGRADDRPRARDAAPRDDERREDRRPAERGNGQRDDRPTEDRPAAAGSQGKPAGGPAASKPKAERRTPITTYALDSVPVTLDDQTDFGATLASRVKEMRQQSDKEGLVRQHVNTIKNLDGPIRKRLMELLAAEGVDVDRPAILERTA